MEILNAILVGLSLLIAALGVGKAAQRDPPPEDQQQQETHQPQR